MKKVVIALAFVTFFGTLVSCNKTSASAVSKIKKENLLNAEKRDSESKGAPVVSFDRKLHDFGTVDEGEVIETTFTVTNSGETDLIILDAKVTCGCTVPTWPKEPIPPGKTGEVQVRFDTSNKPNKQTKTVTLHTNTEKGTEAVTVSGMVIPKNKK